VTRRLASHARQTAVPAKACIVSGLHQFDEGFTREHVDFEFAAAQLFPKMLAQRLLLDAKLIGDFGLGAKAAAFSTRARCLAVGTYSAGIYRSDSLNQGTRARGAVN